MWAWRCCSERWRESGGSEEEAGPPPSEKAPSGLTSKAQISSLLDGDTVEKAHPRKPQRPRTSDPEEELTWVLNGVDGDPEVGLAGTQSGQHVLDAPQLTLQLALLQTTAWRVCAFAQAGNRNTSSHLRGSAVAHPGLQSCSQLLHGSLKAAVLDPRLCHLLYDVYTST